MKLFEIAFSDNLKRISLYIISIIPVFIDLKKMVANDFLLFGVLLKFLVLFMLFIFVIFSSQRVKNERISLENDGVLKLKDYDCHL